MRKKKGESADFAWDSGVYEVSGGRGWRWCLLMLVYVFFCYFQTVPVGVHTRETAPLFPSPFPPVLWGVFSLGI